MTQLDTYESAMLLVGLARAELKGKADLNAQLADIRLRTAEEALRGKIDPNEYERKILGGSTPETSPARETVAEFVQRVRERDVPDETLDRSKPALDDRWDDSQDLTDRDRE